MGSSPNREWSPPIGFAGKTHEVVVFMTRLESTIAAATRYRPPTCKAVATFLERWLAVASDAEEEATASFLYVVLNRVLTDSDEVVELKRVSPIVEFGFGEAPAAPEDWESIPLCELVESAICWLRGTLT